MSDPIQVFGLGEGGVNVDANPLRLLDNELRLSQNATVSLEGRESALVTRPGLARWTGVPLGGPVLGGIEAPYEGTAGATGSGGGGFPGDAGGTGNPSQGTGVGAGDGVVTSGGSINGASVNPPSVSSKLFGGKRLIIVGGQGNAATNGGFWLTTPGFADPAVLRLSNNTGTSGIAAGPPAGNYNTDFPANDTGSGVIQKRAVVSGGNLYYAEGLFGHDVGIAADPMALRRLSFDGNSDLRIIKVPDSPSVLGSATPAPSHLCTITALCPEWGNDDALWIAVYDKVTTGGSAGNYGRLFRLTGLNGGNYALTLVMDTFQNAFLDAGHCVPYSLESYLGSIWVGFWMGRSNSGAGLGQVRPLTTADGQVTGWAWGRTLNLGGGADSTSDTLCVKTYNGILYAGTQARDPTVGHPWIWTVNSAPDATGVHSLQGSGGTAASPLGWQSMEVFNGKLYASYLNYGLFAKIYQFDGTSWTTVLTATGSHIAYSLRADKDWLYAFGGLPVSSETSYLVTQDGASGSWSDKTANFVVPTNTFTPVNLLFGVDQ